MQTRQPACDRNRERLLLTYLFTYLKILRDYISETVGYQMDSRLLETINTD